MNIEREGGSGYIGLTPCTGINGNAIPRRRGKEDDKDTWLLLSEELASMLALFLLGPLFIFALCFPSILFCLFFFLNPVHAYTCTYNVHTLAS